MCIPVSTSRSFTIGLGLIGLILLTGCSDSRDKVTGPGVSGPPTHDLVSLKMSSIFASENCESDPGNPGEFQYTLIVRRIESDGTRVEVGSFGPDTMSLNDGDTLGSTMTPITFLMPRTPGAKFEVEYWVGEYDRGVADFEKHSWATHIFDRDEEEEWAAGTSYDTYNDSGEDETYGILKFAVWSERDDCKGSARYFVSWSPVWVE